MGSHLLAFSWYIYIWPWPIVKVKVRSCKCCPSISHKWWQIGQILLLPIHRKSPIGFRLVYLLLTLAYSKDQSQGHANFDCDYLINGDRYDKHWYCQYIESGLLAFDWHIYIWLLSNHTSIVKNLKSETRCILLHVSINSALSSYWTIKILRPFI